MEETSIIPQLQEANTVQLSLTAEWKTIGDYSIKAIYGSSATEKSIGFNLKDDLLIPFKNQTVKFQADIYADSDNSFRAIIYQKTESNPTWKTVASANLNKGSQTITLTASIPNDITLLWLRIDSLVNVSKTIFTDNWRVLKQ